MKRLISVISCICILMSLFVSPVMADESVNVNEIYFYLNGNETKTLSTGDVSSKLVVSNSGDAKAVNVILCLYNGESKLEAVSLSQGTVSADVASQTLRVPQISVPNAEGREVRVFLWDGISMEPLDKMGVLNSVQTTAPGAIILHTADGSEYVGIFNAETKEAEFSFTSFLAGATAAAGNLMPDMEGAYFTTDNGEELEVLGGEIDFSKTMTLGLTKNGSTEKYTVKAKNYILHMGDDMDNSRTGIPSKRREMNITNRYTSTNPYKDSRPLSGSDEAGNGKALHFDSSNGNADGWYIYCTTGEGIKMVPGVAEEIAVSFDIRYDGFTYYNNNTDPQPYGDILVGQGEVFSAQGSAYAVSFTRNVDFLPTGVTLNDNQFVMGAFGGGADSLVNRKKKLSSPVMNMKQWYSVKQVLKINHVTGEYSYDYYLDGKHIGTVEDSNVDKWIPNGKITGDKVVETDGGVYNLYVRTYKNTDAEFYLDNIKIEYSYGDNNPAVYLVGDSLMAYRVIDNVNRQGHGYYFPEYFDLEQYDVYNMARSGHRAKFYLEGGSHESDGNVYAADWQHIKAHTKKDDVVIISVGLNDTYNWGTEGLKDRLKTMMVEAKERGAKVLAASETPYYANGEIKKNAGLTDAIKTAAQESGVKYYDLEAAFYNKLSEEITGGSTEAAVGEKYFVADGVHLTNEGAMMAAELLANAAEDNLFGEETTVSGATVSFEGIEFEGLINPEKHEITFYVDSARYAGADNDGNIKLSSYSSDKLFANYESYIKAAVVDIKANKTVDKKGVAVDFTGDPVAYKIGDENWMVSFVETNIQHAVTVDEGLLTKDDRLDLPAGAKKPSEVGGALRWEGGGKDIVETAVVKENDNNVFSFKKKNADAKSGVFAFQNIAKSVPTALAVNSMDIKIDELDEKEGFYFGFSSSRESSGDRNGLPSIENSKGALVFTRSGKQSIDDKISLKYVNSFTDKEVKTIEGAPEIDFSKWYNIKTVQKSVENGGNYTVTTEVYVDNIYVGEFLSSYSCAIYRNIMIQLGSWADSKTTFSVKLDNLKTSYIATASDNR